MNGLKDENLEWHRWLEKRVCVKGTLLGTLKYFGETKFCDGLWCGIQLDEPVGKNDGTIKNVKYFTCLPKFGIFVPVSKVCKIENDSKNLNNTFTPLNGTFEVQNCQNTTIIANSDNKSCNDNKDVEDISEITNHCNKENQKIGYFFQQNHNTKSHNNSKNGEINEAKINKTLNNRRDSEESLGLLDPNLIDSLTTSWDSFSLDVAAVDNIAPEFKLNNQEIGFLKPSEPSVSSFVPDEISIPKYASTPLHSVKKRYKFSDMDEIDFPLQNIHENDVFENQVNSESCVYFDFEKLKHNPDLSSTSKILTTLPNMNIVSPDRSITHHSIDLNKTQVIPSAFINSQGILPISMDLNKTQTFQNGCKTIVPNIDALSTTFKMSSELKSEGEDKDELLFQKTFVLGSCLSEEKQSCTEETSVDVLNDVVQFESFDCKSKFLDETVILEKHLSDVNDVKNSLNLPANFHSASNCSLRLSNNFELNSTFHKKSKATSNISICCKNRKSVASIQHKKNNIDKKVAEFKKPLSIYSSIRKPKPKAPLKNIASTVAKEAENSLHSKEIVPLHSDKSLVFNANMNNNVASVEQEKENRQIENESFLRDKSLGSNTSPKTRMSSINVKSKKGRLSASFDLDNKLKKPEKVAVTSGYSRRNSYSQGTASTMLCTTSDLSLVSNKKGTSKNSSKIFYPSSAALPSKVSGISKITLNGIKNTVFAKQTINKTSDDFDNKASMLRLKAPGKGNKLPISRLSLGISSNGNGIPRPNSLASSSKTNLPVGIIKPRYSYLPSIGEKNLLNTKNSEPILEQSAESSKKFVPEASTSINSNKTSRITSSLPQKSQIATRKVGQKYSDVKEESGAKIARYNLRQKK